MNLIARSQPDPNIPDEPPVPVEEPPAPETEPKGPVREPDPPGPTRR